ncbi:hypothetical protein MMC17_009804 [Xylographa soralifera]|nr:hypothetical protein [Xylographa soralifera]
MTFIPSRDIPNLSGKVILVTGGNTGLGKETVLELAKHNPSVIYLTARTSSKGEAAISDIVSAVPKANISLLSLDLSSFESIKNAVSNFKTKSQRLDILFNNAGIMACPMAETAEGYEIQFGTNHLGHALLTKLLLPTMLETAKEPGADVRTITLSSYGHTMAPPSGIIFDKATLAQQTPWTRYGQSKLANLLYAQQLAKHYPSITSVAVHPGSIQTDLWANNVKLNSFVKYGVNVFGRFWMQDVHEGAKNQLWCAVSKDVINGAYYTPIGKKSAGSKNAKNKELADGLWNWTEKELKEHGC